MQTRFNKGAYVNQLDFVILAALEVDVNFNCNVVVGSDGMITGAQGGHPDTAAGAKCTIVIAPLLQGRIPAICTNVTTVTTPGESGRRCYHRLRYCHQPAAVRI